MNCSASKSACAARSILRVLWICLEITHVTAQAKRLEDLVDNGSDVLTAVASFDGRKPNVPGPHPRRQQSVLRYRATRSY
ncbi:hypothetical protein B0T25DRAFT_540561 [Lasiosphaeria hispida]|uniref:Uncharacterized protein n=1 Tax=Lasiosphaeria hispida TaxID=260671 RepID=A0AAJ0HN40_9PEZI|nr:hypothetical protein B0T25DRAFT_540561 [Lasiosphaeria hispida]